MQITLRPENPINHIEQKHPNIYVLQFQIKGLDGGEDDKIIEIQGGCKNQRKSTNIQEQQLQVMLGNLRKSMTMADMVMIGAIRENL